MYTQLSGKNPCHEAQCSHLCLLSPRPTGYSCACPIGMTLDGTAHNCIKGIWWVHREILFCMRGLFFSSVIFLHNTYSDINNVCVCACMCACMMHVCLCVYTCVCVCVFVCMWVFGTHRLGFPHVSNYVSLLSSDSSEILLFMQSRFIAGIKLGSTNVTGIVPVSSISNGQDFDFDSKEGFIYYVEKINVSLLCLILMMSYKYFLSHHLL